MKPRMRHLAIASGCCLGMLVLVWLAVLLESAERNQIDTVAISILDGPRPSSNCVCFGLTNLSSERLCFSPDGYRVYDAARRGRPVNLPETLRTNLVLGAGLSGVLAFESPADPAVWRIHFSVTPVQRAHTHKSLGMLERFLRRQSEQVRGMIAPSPVVRFGAAASNTVEITRRPREVLWDIVY